MNNLFDLQSIIEQYPLDLQIFLHECNIVRTIGRDAQLLGLYTITAVLCSPLSTAEVSVVLGKNFI